MFTSRRHPKAGISGLTKEDFSSMRGVSASPASAAERAEYIEDMVQGIAKLAYGPELERLRDLLALAAGEARRRRGRQPTGGI